MRAIRTMICLGGKSAMGKTPVAKIASDRYEIPVIHTDKLYAPSSKYNPPPQFKVGEKHPQKTKFLQDQSLADIVIVEGCHIMNQGEIDIYMEELNMEVYYVLELVTPDHEFNFEKKYAHADEIGKQGVRNYYKAISDVEATQINTAKEFETIVGLVKTTYIYQDQIEPIKKIKQVNIDWKGKSVIDMGCNVGKYGKWLTDREVKSYLGVDHIFEDIALAQLRNPKLEFRCENIKPNSYKADVILFFAVLHHFEESEIRKLIGNLDCKDMIIEVPLGEGEIDIYQLRNEKWYRNILGENNYILKSSEKSTATNDPHNERRILHFVKK